MGLLDKLIKEGKNIVQNAIDEESKEKAAGLFNDLKDMVEKAGKEIVPEEDREKTSSFFSSLKEEINKAAEKDKEEKAKEEFYYTEDPDDDRTCREKILSVLEKEFPQYEVLTDVSPRDLGGQGRFMNYSIAVRECGELKLVVMIIGKTTTSHREYRWSREFAENNGIVFLNFVEHYPNRVEYISDRLHNYL